MRWFDRDVALVTGFGVFALGLPYWISGHPTKGDSLLAIAVMGVLCGVAAGAITGLIRVLRKGGRSRAVLPPH